jgi:hypothetical protein
MVAYASALSGSTWLELDGQDAGGLHSVEGGEPYAAVVRQPVPTPTSVAGKHLGAISYSDIAIECDLVPSGPLLSWINATLGRSSPLHSGVIVELDHSDKEISRLAFTDAVIREIEFPAVDAEGKQPAYLTVRFASQSTQRHKGSNAFQSKASGTGASMSTRAAPISAFRLTVNGLSTTQVSTVGPLVVCQELQTSVAADGTVRLAPASVEIPDLVVTLREADDWYAWRDAFMVQGTGVERTGTLEYLKRDLHTVLAQIDFTGLGIHSLVTERSDEGLHKSARRVRASMYCENLSYSPAAGASHSAAAGAALPSRVEVITPLAGLRSFARPQLASPS